MSTTIASDAAPPHHRSVSNIKSPPAGGSGTSASAPRTPLRTIPSNFGSPASLRAEEDVVVVEFGTRKLQAGFAGDAAPRGRVWFGPEQQRRAGDFRVWEPGYRDEWWRRRRGAPWGRDHELWRVDLRGQDLGLVGDRIERVVREAYTKYLLIDSRPRRMVCVLPSALPTPLLSTLLDTLFNRFQPPTVYLVSAPVMAAVAAGVRSALVVDLGWAETVVTSVYEYREVHCSRSVRGGRMLVEQTHRFLARLLAQARGQPYEETEGAQDEHVLSFEECEEMARRMVWCKPAEGSAAPTKSTEEGLPTVHEEQDEPAATTPGTVTIPLQSCTPPTVLEIPYESLAEPCETAFFGPQRDQDRQPSESQYRPSSFDDEEQPLGALVYSALLRLPLDVRATCMSRIIFTGGSAAVLGLRARIFDEVARLVRERGWDPVCGRAVTQLRANPRLRRRRGGGSRRAADGPVAADDDDGEGGEFDQEDGVWHDAANAGPDPDLIEEQLRRDARAPPPPVHGRLRALESLGAWSGASLVAHLKVPAVASVDRELWLAQGAAGAGRPAEVDFKAQQRQSMGAGGLMRAAVSGTSWTLGVWGNV